MAKKKAKVAPEVPRPLDRFIGDDLVPGTALRNAFAMETLVVMFAEMRNKSRLEESDSKRHELCTLQGQQKEVHEDLERGMRFGYDEGFQAWIRDSLLARYLGYFYGSYASMPLRVNQNIVEQCEDRLEMFTRAARFSEFDCLGTGHIFPGDGQSLRPKSHAEKTADLYPGLSDAWDLAISEMEL